MVRPVYQKVTKDQYRLVIAQADTMTELSEIVGVTVSAVSKAIKNTKETGIEKEYQVTWIELDED